MLSVHRYMISQSSNDVTPRGTQIHRHYHCLRANKKATAAREQRCVHSVPTPSGTVSARPLCVFPTIGVPDTSFRQLCNSADTTKSPVNGNKPSPPLVTHASNMMEEVAFPQESTGSDGGTNNLPLPAPQPAAPPMMPTQGPQLFRVPTTLPPPSTGGNAGLVGPPPPGPPPTFPPLDGTSFAGPPPPGAGGPPGVPSAAAAKRKRPMYADPLAAMAAPTAAMNGPPGTVFPPPTMPSVMVGVFGMPPPPPTVVGGAEPPELATAAVLSPAHLPPLPPPAALPHDRDSSRDTANTHTDGFGGSPDSSPAEGRADDYVVVSSAGSSDGSWASVAHPDRQHASGAFTLAATCFMSPSCDAWHDENCSMIHPFVLGKPTVCVLLA